MICPQCRAEYRKGFTDCKDCGVPLVDSSELSEAAAQDRFSPEPGDPNEDPFCSFWKGTDLRVCTEICSVLDQAGIPHKTVRRQDHLFHLSIQVPYEIGVPASLYEKAESAIEQAFGTNENAEGAPPLLPAPEQQPRTAALRRVWAGDDMAECVAHCAALKQAGIFYRVDEHGRATERSVEAGYEIGVSEADFENAKAITHHNVMDFSGDREHREIREIPDAGDCSLHRSESRRVASFAEWYPEDATVLAWSGEPAESRWMIEMSMKENNIPMRWETQEEKAKLFVLPEDQQQARQIIREIVEGQPPESS